MATGRPSLRFCSFRLSRQGCGPDECQDAVLGDAGRGRFAVADGASESAHAGLWAQLLVADFVGRDDDPAGWAARLGPVRQRWAAAVAGEDADAAQPWFVEARMRQGAFATLLGVRVDAAGGWEAVAVGDSCLFHVRD